MKEHFVANEIKDNNGAFEHNAPSEPAKQAFLANHMANSKVLVHPGLFSDDNDENNK